MSRPDVLGLVATVAVIVALVVAANIWLFGGAR